MKTNIVKKITFFWVCFILFSSSLLYAADAPVTTAGVVTNAVPGASSVPIPITVTGFTDIGQFTLTLKFNTQRVHYVSATTNPSLSGMTVTYTPPSGNPYGTLIFVWTGTSNVSLSDASSLANLTFSYVSGTGILSWAYTYGSVCQYKRYVGGILTTLTDTPKYLFYKNGGISNRSAPVTFAPVMTITAPGAISVPVTATGFTNIGAVSLSLDYNYSVLHFTSGTPNPLLLGFGAGDQDLGTGYHRITMGYYGGSGISLGDGSTIMTLNFTYISGNTTLTWFDNIPSCEYADGAGDVLIDMPKADYYMNGGVTPPLIANFSADNLTPPKNTTVSFTDLTTGGATSWSWSFDRPGVEYMSGTTAASQNPKVKFTEGGLYAVTLVASNIYLSDPEIKSDYLRAGTAGIWTGNISADWSVTTNWDNWVVPVNSIDVVIPATATNWPVYNGNLTIGVQCKSITLSAVTSQLTVTGNLILQ